MQEFKKIHSGEIISLGGVKYVVAHNFEFSLEGRQIEIWTHLDGKQKLFYCGREVMIKNEKIVFRDAA